MTYTTNAIETFHRQFIKVTKTKTLFPHDDALTKALFLAYRDLSKKWNKPVRNWAFKALQFDFIFSGRFTIKQK